MSDNIVDWVLETIKSEWPTEPFPAVDDWPHEEWPSDILRVNRDAPLVLETDERTRSVELSQGAAIGVSKGDRSSEAIGVGFNFRVMQPVDIRIEGLHENEHGTIADDAAFNDLVAGVRETLKRQRKDPEIDGGEVHYHTISFEAERDQIDENKDYYRTDLRIEFLGNEFRDD